MSHTPGPWEVLFCGATTVSVGPCVDGGCGGEYPEPPQYEPVCHVHWCPEYKTSATPEQMANARLIAAAPDLLEALEWYVANDDTMEMSDNAVWLAGRDKAIAAIKKAKGGAG